MKEYLLEEIYQKATCENPNESITFGWLMDCIEEIRKGEKELEKEK